MCHRLQQFLKPFSLHYFSFFYCSPSPLSPLSLGMLWPRLWPGWFVCSWSWKDNDNGTVCSASLCHCGMTSWVLEGSKHTAFSGVHSALGRFWTVSALFGRGMCAPGQCSCCSPSISWYPADPGAHEPARVRAGGRKWGWCCKHLGWCFGGGRTHQLCGPCAQYSRLDQISVVTNLAPRWLRCL